MDTPLPHLIPKEAATPVKPELSPLQILSLAQLAHEFPEFALELATLEGRRFDDDNRKARK